MNKGERKGIIMQKGSFNPFHRMHNNIAQDVIKAYPDYPHVLVLSNNTCDKGVNDENVLTDRIEKLTALGYYVMVTKSGQFLHNVKKIRSYYKDLHIVFPVGDDTIERFFRDWEKFFDEEIEVKSMRYTQYNFTFENVDWYITGRKSETKHFGDLLPKYEKYLNNFKYSTIDMDDISSSYIRAGIHENKL
jgi:nicotinic acid mononucleotide adenylyltransferase